MTNSKKTTMTDRVAAQLKLELDMCIGSAADQGAALEAFLAVAFPPRKASRLVSFARQYAPVAVAFVAPIASLAGIMFAGLAL